MADGALRVAGNWDTVRSNIVGHLKGDDSLWDEASQTWLEHIVIQIDYDGALVISPGLKGSEETIIAFPGDQPGSFSKQGEGTVIGGGIVLAASLAELLTQDQFTHDDLETKTGEGLTRARELVRQGYEEDPDPERDTMYPQATLDPSAAQERPTRYAPPDDSLPTALEIITVGDDVLRRKIVYSVGKLLTCDPVFAEELIRLEERVKSHAQASGDGVLSLAVFGGPGSGKSFAVGEVQQSIGGDLTEMAFNVSQFDSPQRLVNALTQVQAVSLRGQVPFVQWDEFDCVHEGNRGGWLSKFLMPMQDAEFWDGSIKRALGKCVFVFVGGTWGCKEELEDWMQGAGRDLKGRDFQSRLDRILEVPPVDIAAEGEASVRGCPMLNRAIVIRLALRDKKLGSINRNVAEFLLTAPLEHGTRSLKTIIDASDLSRTQRFCAYHLPPREVLEVHVAGNPDDYLADCTERLPLQWASG